jgi:hypothetical protein
MRQGRAIEGVGFVNIINNQDVTPIAKIELNLKL